MPQQDVVVPPSWKLENGKWKLDNGKWRGQPHEQGKVQTNKLKQTDPQQQCRKWVSLLLLVAYGTALYVLMRVTSIGVGPSLGRQGNGVAAFREGGASRYCGG
eukprot:5286658-Prymnesium_polylepis.1